MKADGKERFLPLSEQPDLRIGGSGKLLRFALPADRSIESGSQTLIFVLTPTTLLTGLALARRLAKIPVVAGICDRFIGNTILKVTRAQAERLILPGATPREIDGAMHSFGMPIGPFEAQDLGGLEIASLQRKAARERGETPFAPIADRLVDMGRLGQKSGGGWYDFSPGDRTPQPSQAVAALVADAASTSLSRQWSAEAIVDVIVLQMIR
jgi:3-hydroxyacyl-CoA dehydrogenase